MATEGQNLSAYNLEELPDASGYRIAVVVSEWNKGITENLLKGAIEPLKDAGVKEDNLIINWVPGTFELSLGAQYFYESNSNVDAVICIGSVIQGETKHFDFVCEAAAQGIKDVGLKYNKPTIFCVLTDNSMQQAIDRSGGRHGNKGVEAGVACLKMVALWKSVSK